MPKELFENMEGKLTDDELHSALFEHMNGSSSPGVDGSTVNHLRVFWPDMKDLTCDALNASIGKLTRVLNSAIIKLLRKGEYLNTTRNFRSYFQHNLQCSFVF